MARRAIHAPRQESGHITSATDTRSSDRSILSFSTISAPTATSDPGTIITASPLTTYTSYSTTAFVSSGVTYKQSQPIPLIVTNSAELSSLSAAGAFDTATASGATVSAAAPATASATTAATGAPKSSSSNTSTLVPAIVIPVVVVLLASFAAFFFFMRRRHHRALEEEARFEKINSKPSASLPPADNNSSSRNLLPAAAAYGQSADEKPHQSSSMRGKSLPDGHASGPRRPRRPEETDIPSSAIGIARSTSSASAVYANGGARPPRSAHEMRGLASTSRPEKRVPRSQVLSGGDIIDSYAAMRPNTAPSGSARGFSPSAVSRTPLPVKPMGRPPPKNPNPPPPQYIARAPASPQAHHSPGLSRARAGSSDSSYSLTEENLRIARLANGPRSTQQTLDSASVSDIDEHDHTRAGRDYGSDVSDLDEEQERMASGLNSPVGTGRGTPMSGRFGTPLSGRDFVR